MRREVAQSFENRKGKIGRGQLMRETFANQSSQFGLMVERVEARDNPSGAVPE